MVGPERIVIGGFDVGGLGQPVKRRVGHSVGCALPATASAASLAAAWAALALAADPQKYRALAKAVGMSDSDVDKSADYGAEIHRSWRRILAPLWMPEGMPSGETRVQCEGSGVIRQLYNDDVAKELHAVAQRFDWHSRVTIRFTEGEGSAAWSRSKRTITVPSEYVQRFIEQGRRVRK